MREEKPPKSRRKFRSDWCADCLILPIANITCKFCILYSVILFLYTGSCSKLSWIIFTFMCFITGQYVPHKIKGNRRLQILFNCLFVVYTAFFMVGFGSIVNIWPTALILFDTIACPVQYFNVCYTILTYDKSIPGDDDALPHLLLNVDTTNNPAGKRQNFTLYLLIYFLLLR